MTTVTPLISMLFVFINAEMASPVCSNSIVPFVLKLKERNKKS